MIAIDREIRIIMAVDMVNGIGEIFFGAPLCFLGMLRANWPFSVYTFNDEM